MHEVADLGGNHRHLVHGAGFVHVVTLSMMLCAANTTRLASGPLIYLLAFQAGA
jgi:hypothetical protein